MKECPKNAIFSAILVDKHLVNFFQSHLIYIFIIDMMQNCTYMFKASLIFKKIKSEKNIINIICMQLKNVPRRSMARHGICALLVTDRQDFFALKYNIISCIRDIA